MTMSLKVIAQIAFSLLGAAVLYVFVFRPRQRRAAPAHSRRIFADESQRILAEAVHLAARYHQTELRTEHVLWALFTCPGECLAQILQRLPMDLAAARAHVETIVSGYPQQGLWRVFHEPWVSLELRAILAGLGEADVTAEELAPIMPQHLLMALARIDPAAQPERAGLTGRILRDLGLTSDRLAEAIREVECVKAETEATLPSLPAGQAAES